MRIPDSRRCKLRDSFVHLCGRRDLTQLPVSQLTLWLIVRSCCHTWRQSSEIRSPTQSYSYASEAGKSFWYYSHDDGTFHKEALVTFRTDLGALRQQHGSHFSLQPPLVGVGGYQLKLHSCWAPAQSQLTCTEKMAWGAWLCSTEAAGCWDAVWCC